MPKPELLDFDVSLINETEPTSNSSGAWLIRTPESKKIWVPKSLCTMEEGRKNRWTLTIPAWLAEEKGLI